MPEKPGGTEITELAALKALAQPRRQQILQHLTLHGPATSAILARALGLNTGATSYHLRELARYGFVTDTVPQAPGGGRARWWRAVPGDRRFPPPSRRTPGMRLVMDELNRHAYAADLALFERLQRESGAAGASGDGAAPDEWADAHAYSRGSLRLTLPELQQFFEEYIALMNRYKRPEAETPPGARTVHTRLLAFPAPGEDGHDLRSGEHGHDPAPGEDGHDPRGVHAPRGARTDDNGRETDAS
ncbi:ArsR/SmtB family transcription factor [Streptomyces sp. NBC_00236]|uniref:ArsR/SmtB family transcription factor n=1 Tax=Streptomyces sp. NBC_00236 TaxID=2903639 RepID=UPI002E2D444D|nr:helix-turn-helix domain-containing protein [Streptomyces sp. NBC_00236]